MYYYDLKLIRNFNELSGRTVLSSCSSDCWLEVTSCSSDSSFDVSSLSSNSSFEVSFDPYESVSLVVLVIWVLELDVVAWAAFWFTVVAFVALVEVVD